MPLASTDRKSPAVLKVVYAIDGFGPGGSQSHLRDLAASLNRDRFSPTVVCLVSTEAGSGQDFAGVVMDLWAASATPTERDGAFEALSTRVVTAKTRYEQTRDLDQALLSENYEV